MTNYETQSQGSIAQKAHDGTSSVYVVRDEDGNKHAVYTSKVGAINCRKAYESLHGQTFRVHVEERQEADN